MWSRPSLVKSIRPALDQFEQDLCASGYATIEHTAGFASPPALRAYLSATYSKIGGSLAGAILVGYFPHAYEWVTLTSANPAIPSSSEEVISLQYYADLDGTFAKSHSYTSPGGHLYSFDLHTGGTGWEIWIAVLPTYKSDPRRTTAAMNRYFAKNHAYRAGQLTRPNVFLEVDEHAQVTTLADHTAHLAELRTGKYSWTPFSGSPAALLYFNSPPAGMSAAPTRRRTCNGRRLRTRRRRRRSNDGPTAGSLHCCDCAGDSAADLHCSHPRAIRIVYSRATASHHPCSARAEPGGGAS